MNIVVLNASPRKMGNTSQFSLNNMFDAEHKIESEKTQFPKDLKKAYELGQRLSGEISKTD